ncbi:MAG TPA: protoglobin domain-containing protein [Polyangia bacterium]|nr:protoglobin domain-containing protein [Polyangia bacterium]
MAAVGESFFAEMKRYVRFEPADGEALQWLLPHIQPHFGRIAETFYARLAEHAEARQVFTGPEQVERLKVSLCQWLDLLFRGPWDEDYYERRSRIGHMHVAIRLPQRYMFGAMNLIRCDLRRLAGEVPGAGTQPRLSEALDKIIDLELAIMLESYREAFVSQVRALEQREKDLLRRRLAVSEARYEEIIEQAEAVVITLDTSGRILLFNRHGEELTGLPRSEVVGRLWLELFAPPSAPSPGAGPRADGKSVLAVRLIDVQAGGRVPSYAGQIRRVDGDVFLVRWHFTMLPGSNKPIVCVIGVVTAEAHRPIEERRAAVSAAASALSDPARPGRSYGAHGGGGPEVTELVAHELQRLALVVEEFLCFARPPALQLTAGDLGETARAATELARTEAMAAGVDLRFHGDLRVSVRMDEERLRQAIFNLVRNGIEATGRRGHVEVHAGAFGRHAFVEVLDDGHGLLGADAPIFEPFWSTKRGGTGLGLCVTKRVVEDHGGQIEVESRPGQTLFTLRLPLLD